MNFLELLLYSFIQGVTEFLPISSSAHLNILEIIFGWSGIGRTYAIAAHLGTLITLLIFLRSDLLLIIKKANFKLFNKKNENNKTILNIIIITIPIVLVGLFIFKTLDNMLLNLKIIGWSSILGALLLLVSDKFKLNKIKLASLSYLQAFFIGLMQCFALIPGTSRAGMIITACRFMKISRQNSTQIVLYTGIPTITAAVTIEFLWLIKNSNQLIHSSVIIVTLLSCFFSYISIIYLFKLINNYSFLPFVIYRLIIGSLIIAIAYT